MLKIVKILFLKKFFDVDIYVYVGLIGWVFIFIIYIVKDLIWVKLFLRSFFFWRKLFFKFFLMKVIEKDMYVI